LKPLSTLRTPCKDFILNTIRRSGPVPFERYMHLCLYHPDFGYYMQNRERTGKEGDYFTSPDLHPIFARLLARQAAEMWELTGRPNPFAWVEMGAGRGLFAVEFLEWIRRERPDFCKALTYVVIEPGTAARLGIEKQISDAGLGEYLRVSSTLQEVEPVTGCFFSNELVDAFPVAVVTRANGRLREIYVHAEGDTLIEKPGPISNPAIAAAVARYAKELEEGQRAEVCLAALEWIRRVAEKLLCGFVITIDYGDLAQRLYTADRPRGTLLSYFHHTVSEDFYAAPGEQDLTAHVNFSALIDAGREAGLGPAGFTTQERFLMALGEGHKFADVYDPGQDDAQKLQARLRLKRLLNPEGMGSIFKVLIQYRRVSSPALIGMKFARGVQPARRNEI
jgi:SAM-dependent MidA family methyltransferase